MDVGALGLRWIAMDERHARRRPPPAPTSHQSTEWYVALRDETHGPFEADALAEVIRAGRLPPSTHVWHTDLPAWARVRDVAELARLLPQPRPVSAPPAPAPSPVVDRETTKNFAVAAGLGARARRQRWAVAGVALLLALWGAAAVAMVITEPAPTESVADTAAPAPAPEVAPPPALDGEALRRLAGHSAAPATSSQKRRRREAVRPGASAAAIVLPEPIPIPAPKQRIRRRARRAKKRSRSAPVLANLPRTIEVPSAFDRDATLHALSPQLRKATRCFERLGASADRLHVEVKVTPQGRVRLNRAASSLDGRTASCLARKMRRWRVATFEGQSQTLELPMLRVGR